MGFDDLVLAVKNLGPYKEDEILGLMYDFVGNRPFETLSKEQKYIFLLIKIIDVIDGRIERLVQLKGKEE
jgi:hypothetical protein